MNDICINMYLYVLFIQKNILYNVSFCKPFCHKKKQLKYKAKTLTINYNKPITIIMNQ